MRTATRSNCDTAGVSKVKPSRALAALYSRSSATGRSGACRAWLNGHEHGDEDDAVASGIQRVVGLIPDPHGIRCAQSWTDGVRRKVALVHKPRTRGPPPINRFFAAFATENGAHSRQTMWISGADKNVRLGKAHWQRDCARLRVPYKRRGEDAPKLPRTSLPPSPLPSLQGGSLPRQRRRGRRQRPAPAYPTR